MNIFELVNGIGLLERENKPEKIKCPYCGNKSVYLWKHVAGYYCGAECSACETVTLMNFTDSRKKAVENVLGIEKHFDAYKEDSK